MAGRNSRDAAYAMSGGSLTLLRCLTDPSLDEISWAKPAGKILTRIQQIYDIYNLVENLPERALSFGQKLKELDGYMYMDIEKQIATSHLHMAYYLPRIGNIIDRAADGILACAKGVANGPLSIERSKATNELFDQLWAELEAAFIEFGFCSKLQILHDVDDVTCKLEAMNLAADDLLRNMASQDRGQTMKVIQRLVAEQDGIDQSLSDHVKRVTKNRKDQLANKINNIENRIVASLAETAVHLKDYLTNQTKLNLPVLQAIGYDNCVDAVNFHNMHPNTRNWVLHRFNQFLRHRHRRIFILTAREGFGKSTISSTICKLHFNELIAMHFFGDDSRNRRNNQLVGLVQSVAAGLARTTQGYLRYLQDTHGQEKSLDFLEAPWHVQYDVLIRKPLNKLFVKMRPTSGRSRDPPIEKESRVLVIDGIGRCFEQEYVRTFMLDFIRDFPSWMKLCLTVNSTHVYNVAMPDLEDYVETMRLDDRPWMGMHIKDLETYMGMAISALLQDASENQLFSNRARSDEKTLQNVLEELTKYSCGRFDYALELTNTFAEEMAKGGQFLGSIKKAMQLLQNRHGRVFDEQLSDFASAFRSYRDREGRDILVSPVSASHSLHLLSLTRIAKLRSKHHQTVTAP